jgi:hypothetical protein
MSRFWNVAVISAALMVPMAIAPMALRAQDQRSARTFHDKEHNDDHAWNGQEDKAYHIYANIAIFPSSKRTINRITGTGATNIPTPCSRSK